MATTLGGTTLPEPAYGPNGCRTRWPGSGTIVVMEDNSLRKHAPLNQRQAWDLFWVNISATDLATIQTAAVIETEQSFSPPYEDDTYQVLVRLETFTFDRTHRDATVANNRYNVWLTVEQSSFA